jgi:hypothetical protein
MLHLGNDFGVRNMTDLIDLMAVSEKDKKLRISGQSILLNTAKMLSGILPACGHLTSEFGFQDRPY